MSEQGVESQVITKVQKDSVENVGWKQESLMVWSPRNLCLKEEQWIVNSVYRCWKGHWTRCSRWGHNFKRCPFSFFC